MKKLIFYSCLLLISISASAQIPSYVPTNGLVGYWPFNGNANDISGNGNNGAPGSGVTLTSDRYGSINKAFNFSGNGNIGLLNLPTTGTQNFTIAGWVRTNHTNGRKGIICWGQDTPNSSTYLFINTSNKLAFDLAYNGGPESPVVITDNQWHFVLVTNTSGLMQLYLDGNISGTSLMMSPNINGNNKSIGANITNSGSDNFIGDLDDFGIWNRALTQQEITAFYNQALNPVLPNYVPSNGLVAYYPFNGNANDASGNGNNGVVNGATLTTDRNGVINNSYVFNPANSSHIVVPFTNSLNSIQTGLTMAAWAFMDGGTSIGTPPRIMELRGAYGGGGNAGFVMLAWGNSNTNRTFETRWYNNSGNNNISISPTSTVTGLNWHYLVYTADGNTGIGKFYVDGVLVNTNSGQASQGTINACNYNNNSLYIGAEPNLLGKWGGKLDDIGIWNRALTQSEITALYNQAPNPVLPSNIPTSGLVAYYPFNGNANDLSGNNLNGTVTGAVLTSDRFGTSNNAYNFDYTHWSWGSGGDEIFIPFNSILNTPNLTVSVWAMRNSAGYTSQQQTVISRYQFGYSTPYGEHWQIYADPSPSCLIKTSIINSNGVYSMNNGPSLLLNNWFHIAMTFDGTTVKQFINGTLYNSIPVNGLLLNVNGNSGISIGVSDQANGHWAPFDGKIDDIGIWNRALTQSEITTLYNTPTVAASDSLWVINKQTDTLAFPSQVKLSLKSNNITSKNISAYDIKLNYDASKLKFDSVTKTNTASANGSVIVNSATTGQVIIGWASSSSISSTTLPLLNCFFTPIDSGKTTVSISNAIFNTDTVKNRYSKSVINKFNFGDVDMNKIIQSYDASIVLKYSIGIDPLPTVDPLPWEPWRIKVASVDSAVSVDANDASLILKYSVGLITKFPKRGMASAPGYVTVNLENNELVVRSFEDMGGLNITFLDHLSDLGAPTYVHNTNALSAFNKQTNMYKIGVAFSEAPVNGTVILRIPYTGLGSQTLNMELVENTAARNYQLNVVTGINDIKNSNIKIYPNPSNNIINIEGLNKNENNTIQIFDVQGKLVITKTITEKGAIDLSELNKGVYVIKIGELAQRIVKM